MSEAKDWFLKIQFAKDIIDEWASSVELGVGVCLLCGSVIHTEEEFISGTNTHDCPAGRSLERLDLTF
jgi:hypothetical protein